jgi:hypothetical protein
MSPIIPIKLPPFQHTFLWQYVQFEVYDHDVGRSVITFYYGHEYSVLLQGDPEAMDATCKMIVLHRNNGMKSESMFFYQRGFTFYFVVVVCSSCSSSCSSSSSSSSSSN